MRAFPRERFSSEVTLSPETVVSFANAAGDNNPIHHDPEFAATTRFGRPTASGPHKPAPILARPGVLFPRLVHGSSATAGCSHQMPDSP